MGLNWDKRKQKTKKSRSEQKFVSFAKRYFSMRYILIGLVALVVVLMFKSYIKGVILLIFFFPLALYSTRVAKFIDYVTIETHSASTVLLGYMYGSTIGEVVGFLLSSYAYLGNGMAKVRAYLDIGFSVFAGWLAGYLQTKGFDFSTAFILAILGKNAVSFLLNHFFFDPNKFSNMMYRVTSTTLNILIYRIFFVAIYNLVNIF